MPTFRGNKGNLLQHWVLAELTLLLRRQLPSSARLCLLDAHAMSPYATRYPGALPSIFDVVRDGLPGQRSAYEQAWWELTNQNQQHVVYPTSAMFVSHLWPGPLSMVLCDIDKTTIDDIATWKAGLKDADAIRPHH